MAGGLGHDQADLALSKWMGLGASGRERRHDGTLVSGPDRVQRCPSLEYGHGSVAEDAVDRN